MPFDPPADPLPSDHPPDEPSTSVPSAQMNDEIPIAEQVSAPTSHNPGDTGLRHLHPTSLVFDLIAHGRSYLVPILFGLFGAANGNSYILIISGIMFVPAVMVSVFRYVTLRYHIEDAHLIVDEGLIFRKTRKVPIDRIQNIDLVQNVLHRIFDVAEVKIETASGTEPEAVLRVLSMSQMESLRASVFGGSANVESVVIDEATGAANVHDIDADHPVRPATANRSGDVLHRISVFQLIKAGLASNRGLIMVGILIGGYFQFSEATYSQNFEQLYRLMPKMESTSTAIALGLIATLVALVLLRLLGIGWYIMQFFGYQLEQRGDDLRISCGLFTKISATVPRKRIQFISIHRTLFMRLFGLASIRIETAGGAGGEQQNSTGSVSKRWFVPVIEEDDIPNLLEALRPGLGWNENEFEFRPLADRAFRRMVRIGLLLCLLVIGAGLAIWRPWGFIPGTILLPIMLLWVRKSAASMRYARTDKSVVYRSGVLNRKISVTFFEKIQTLRIDQTPFDRRWRMARLTVDTAAAGPAAHVISVPYLDEAFAKEEFQALREMTGINQPVFG